MIELYLLVPVDMYIEIRKSKAPFYGAVNLDVVNMWT
jgi:hypothetical protein